MAFLSFVRNPPWYARKLLPMLSFLSYFQCLSLQSGYLIVIRKADELSYPELESCGGKLLNFVSGKLQMGKIRLLEFTLNYPL